MTRVEDVFSSCDWRQEENLRKKDTKMEQREVPGFKERRHTWVETGTNPRNSGLGNALEEERAGFEALG